MRHFLIRLSAAALALLCACTVPAATPTYGYRVVHRYPHDAGAFTQGLVYLDGALYEGTGQNGESSVRKVELATGKVLKRQDLPLQYFGEGIVDWKDTLIQITWRNQTGFVYDRATFALKKTFRYPGEGWGLTRDATRLFMSDGSSTLRILDPATLQQTGRIDVTADGRPVPYLNEIEWVKGRIFANVWMTNRIAIIDPATGKVSAWLDLAGILDTASLPEPGNDVLNGIAYDAAKDRLFVTGKRWPTLFEITLVAPKAR